MAKARQQKRFTVSLDAGDYKALRALAEGKNRPPRTLQYVVSVAIKDLLNRHATRQLMFPLDE